MVSAEIRRLKITLLISSIVCFVLLILSAYHERFAGTWRGHQSAYRSAAIKLASDESAKATAIGMENGFKQVFLPDLERIDRCTTCHVGVEDPRMAGAELPIAAHSGDIFKHHPLDKFGCTVCHDGQGRAVELPAAHGEVPHWEAPLLRGEKVYTTCSRCHYENDPYGWNEDLYARGGALDPLDQMELTASIPPATDPREHSIARGKRLFLDSGCLGCHQYRGRGGKLGPEITYVGDKTAHDFDFAHVASDEHSVEQWLFEHFKRPAEISPGSIMPDMKLGDEQAGDLTNYMLSLHRKTMPASHTPVPARGGGQPATGSQLYGMFCSSCHGKDGYGATVRDPSMDMLVDAPRELMTPSLNHPDTLAVASDDYLRHIISEGRAGTSMPAWKQDFGGLRGAEIDRLVAYIRSWEAAPSPLDGMTAARGNPKYGRAIFRTRCVNCHGRKGEGGIGVALNSPNFLAAASDPFLAAAIVYGRPNTAMPSWKQFDADEVSDLLAYIRTWQKFTADKDEVLATLAKIKKPGRRSLRIGKSVYRSKCAACHGDKGQGATGPSLNTDDFLSVVDNDYLLTAIVEGRPGTAMPAWSQLSDEDLVDLIGFVRGFNKNNRRELAPYLASGDWDRGRILYAGVCSGCHGRSVEGGTGPQLANSVFLRSVSDAVLREWISHGRSGTEMRSFLKGGQGMVELSEAQIDDIVTYLRYLESGPVVPPSRQGLGIAALGAEMYASACLSCHGPSGEGMTGSALSNPNFLKSASDGFLAATIILGRDGTEMLPMGAGMQGNVELTSDQVANLIAFLRTWEHDPPVEGIPARYVTGADTVDGRELYMHQCAGCHGNNGGKDDDGWAPALNNHDFLRAATDGFLQATIARGRDGTSMRPFGVGTGGVADLTTDQINNIVAFIRTWAAPGNKPSDAPAEADEKAEAPKLGMKE